MTAISDVLGGRYRLLELLGHGGMSDVYRALDEQSGAIVALKIVRSGDPEFARRLSQEARTLERLTYPGLIALLDTGFNGDQSYLVMEFVAGETLAQRLRGGPIASQVAAAMGARLANALGYVHESGIVHRDLKPSNILLGADGEAWLGDFGIAQLHDATTMTATGFTLGTVSYMAPEQLDDHQVGPKADIWSLGIVLLECLTGRRVYEGSPSEVVARRVGRPLTLPADLPAPWRLVLSGMLELGPEQRPSGPQVASLLATPAFDLVWTPADSDLTTCVATPGAREVTSLMAGVFAGASLDPDATRMAPPPPVVTGSAGASVRERLRALKKTGTDPRRPGASHRARRGRLVVAVIVVFAVLALALALASRSNPSVSTLTSTLPPSTTSATTRATTSTGPTALANLVRDAATGQVNGTIASTSAQAVTNAAEMALTEQGLDNIAQAQSDLQQAASSIATGLQGGLITPSEGALLQGDLVSLASALALAPPSATSTTTPAPPIGPGHGHGKKNHP